MLAVLATSVVFSACAKSEAGGGSSTQASNAGTTPQGNTERETSKAAASSPDVTPVAKGYSPSAQAELAFESVTLGGEETEALPWLVALHGLGDTPQNFLHLLRGSDLRAHVYALRAIHPYGDGFDWYDARINGNQRILSRAMDVAVDKVATWVEAHAKDSQNQGKPVVFGFSQGGMLSFALATRRPELFRAAIPMSGLLPKELWPEGPRDVNIPILALHGTEDRVIPIAPARDLVSHLKTKGFDASLTEFDGVAHRIPSNVRARLLDNLTQHLK
jgi:phospholipase/carboxylesterase